MHLMQLLLLISVSVLISKSDFIGKCCDYDETLKEFDNSTYVCTKNFNKRQFIYTTSVNLTKTASNGKCLDLNQNFYEYHFDKNLIIDKTLIVEDYYTKCCPLGYIYNDIKHSCDRKNDLKHDFIDKRLVKVGLPHCRVIKDSLLVHYNGSYSDDGSCIDETSSGYVKRFCVEDTEICDEMRCVKKCCPDGKSFLNGPNCVDTFQYGIDLQSSKKIEKPSGEFAIIHNNSICPNTFYLFSENRYEFQLLEDGTFQYWLNSSNSYVKEPPTFSEGGYCMEYANKNKLKGYFFFHCLSKPKSLPPKFEATKYPKILSCIFLALTILIYLLLGQTRKLFGKILINYCISTFLMFAILIYAQFSIRAGDIQCQLVGYGIIFVTTVSMAWLNVMCCDIWLTFGTTKNSLGVYQRKKDLKKLLLYMVYGWGTPLILTLLIYGLSITESLSDTIRPYVGNKSCFLENRSGNYAQIVFLRVPHLIFQLINAFLFIKTIIYCLKIKNEIQKINDNRDEKKRRFLRDKEKLFLILKLAVIMGITFIIDTVTSFVNFHTLGPFWSNFEIVVDCINCLQGVYIFIIFICKRSVYKDFLKKLHIRRRNAYINNTTLDSIGSSTQISLKVNRKESTYR